ncbi:MAG TPA: sensor histidine kinase [Alphaproteobacteria bacterium]|nr:sensor histidine kinase [Alphaproteobacteria bacterium]
MAAPASLKTPKRDTASDALPPVERALSGTTSFTIVFALLVAAVPLLLFGAWLIYSETQRQQADIEAMMRERAHNLMADLESELLQQSQVVQTLAALPQLDEPDLPLFYKAASRAQSLRPHWVAISLVEPATGMQVLNTLQPLGTPLPPIQNAGGVIEAARAGELRVWTQVRGADASVPRPSLNIAAPVVRDGKVRFILVASIDNEALQAFMRARKLPAGWITTIYDSEGVIVARTPNPEEYVGRPTAPDLIDLLRRQGDGVVKRQLLDGETVYTAFERSQFAGWALAVHAPEADIEHTIPGHSLFVTMAGAAALMTALALGVLFLREVVHRRAEAQTQHLLEHTQHLLARQEMLLREVHHRVKNNLQTMASMVRIVARKGSPDAQPAFQDIARRIATLGHAYDQIHKAEDMAQLDLGVYLKNVANQVGNSFGRDEVRVVTMLDPLVVDIDTALPVGLIAGELVTNAYKHAFTTDKAGQLTVKLRDLGEYAMLTVRDTGPGIGTDPFTRSAGLRIAEALAAQVDGRLKAKNHPTGGAQFRLTFPVKRRKKAAAQRSTAAHATGG